MSTESKVIILRVDGVDYDPRVIVHINDRARFLESLKECWEEIIVFELPNKDLMCMVQSDVMWICKGV